MLEEKSLTWTKEQLQKLIDDYKGVGSVQLKAVCKSEMLWDAQVGQDGGNSIVNKASNDLLDKAITSELDRIGATDLIITDVVSKQKIDTRLEKWEEKFLDATIRQGNASLIPDTNFIMRRYGSGLLRRLGKNDFSFLRFNIPNLVVLEIEAIHNRAKKKSESEKCEDKERTKALIEMREALIATKELIFLRDRSADILDAKIDWALRNFQEIAGKGLTDMYIRKEIRDATKLWTTSYVKFLTCDLMNALSAVAEGLPVLYFQRLTSEKYYLSEDYDCCLEQLAELIINTTFVLGEITLTAQPIYGKPQTKTLRGDWADWTIEDLLNNRIIEEMPAPNKK